MQAQPDSLRKGAESGATGWQTDLNGSFARPSQSPTKDTDLQPSQEVLPSPPDLLEPATQVIQVPELSTQGAPPTQLDPAGDTQQIDAEQSQPPVKAAGDEEDDPDGILERQRTFAAEHNE